MMNLKSRNPNPHARVKACSLRRTRAGNHAANSNPCVMQISPHSIGLALKKMGLQLFVGDKARLMPDSSVRCPLRFHGIIPFFAERTVGLRASPGCPHGIAQAHTSPSAAFPVLPQAGKDSGLRPSESRPAHAERSAPRSLPWSCCPAVHLLSDGSKTCQAVFHTIYPSFPMGRPLNSRCPLPARPARRRGWPCWTGLPRIRCPLRWYSGSACPGAWLPPVLLGRFRGGEAGSP